MKVNSLKTMALLGFALFFLACNKEESSFLEQEIQTEKSVFHDEETFVPISKATDIAAAFFGILSKNPATKSNARLVSTETIFDRSGDEALMYLINYVDGGFVIVSATKDYYPILAHSEEGSFIMSEDMGGVVVWLEETKEAIRQSASLDEKTKTEIHSIWRKYEPIANMISTNVATKSGTPEQDNARDYRIAQLNNMGYTCYTLSSAYANGLITINEYQNWSAIADDAGGLSSVEYALVAFGSSYSVSQVGPLLQTTWNQGYPYNSQVPLISGQRPPLGCVTIAVAQIMAYHKWPSSYNWTTMLQQGGGSTVTQDFLYNLALSLKIKFGLDGSSGYNSDAISTFKAYGYSSSISEVNHSAITVRPQLAYNVKQPVYMSGQTYDATQNKYVGHAWVCDGHKAETVEDIYFAEFLTGSPGTYSYSSQKGAPSLTNPSSSGGIIYNSYSMNWGWGGSYNGWFNGDNVDLNNGWNFNGSRKNIINIKK